MNHYFARLVRNAYKGNIRRNKKNIDYFLKNLNASEDTKRKINVYIGEIIENAKMKGMFDYKYKQWQEDNQRIKIKPSNSRELEKEEK